ncbi:hypothetical protein NDK50_06425 [Paraburkholderia bryophila]|uniref:hypothetical protein n=1 Tax=Paraburkholderia bryophila TaxID=420952 RepID=UPI002349096E|nr:hypothetical protein [Paraburkholderia bryophila]WCM21090.1 hypothetical protein NDK50_06425 [Paraburkholderia bryophila]
MATRIPTTSEVASIRRFFRRRGETLSLAGGVGSIVIGSLAFWFNQPAHLFDGAAAQREVTTFWSSQACGEPPLARGLLSLELATHLQRDVPTRPDGCDVEAARRCALPHLLAAATQREACRAGV